MMTINLAKVYQITDAVFVYIGEGLCKTSHTFWKSRSQKNGAPARVLTRLICL